MAQMGIDLFTFEDKLNTIDALNITAVLHRGSVPKQATIELRGYIPRSKVNLATDTDSVKAVSPQS
jgi:hypothetical protein